MKRIGPIIPVLDLMIGQIVLAAGGNRDEYRPVATRLTQSSRPLDVAKAMHLQTGCEWMYLADIDSFAGAQPGWNVYNELLDHGFGLWIDANWLAGDHAHWIGDRILHRERLQLIISTETMSSETDFEQLGKLIADGHRLVFSLDKRHDSIITRPGGLSSCTPLEMVHRAHQQGVRDLIILDLASVGTMQGVSHSNPFHESLENLLREIHQELPDMGTATGGGVRDAADAQAILDLGCQHVLVASAIHECRFTPDDVAGLVRR